MSKGIIEKVRIRSFDKDKGSSIDFSLLPNKNIIHVKGSSIDFSLLNSLNSFKAPSPHVPALSATTARFTSQFPTVSAATARFSSRLAQEVTGRPFMLAPWFHDIVNALALFTGQRPLAEGVLAMGFLVFGGIKRTVNQDPLETGAQILSGLQKSLEDTRPADETSLTISQTIEVLKNIMGHLEDAYNTRTDARAARPVVLKMVETLLTGASFFDAVLVNSQRGQDVLDMISQWLDNILAMFIRQKIQLQPMAGKMMERLARRLATPGTPDNPRSRPNALQKARGIATAAEVSPDGKAKKEKWARAAWALMAIASSDSYSRKSIGFDRYEEAAQAFELAGDPLNAAHARMARTKSVTLAADRFSTPAPAEARHRQQANIALNALEESIAGLAKAIAYFRQDKKDKKEAEAVSLMKKALDVSLVIIAARCSAMREPSDHDAIKRVERLLQTAAELGLREQQQKTQEILSKMRGAFLDLARDHAAKARDILSKAHRGLVLLQSPRTGRQVRRLLKETGSRLPHAKEAARTAKDMFDLVKEAGGVSAVDSLLAEIDDCSSRLEQLRKTIGSAPARRRGPTRIEAKPSDEEHLIRDVIMLIMNGNKELANVKLGELAARYEDNTNAEEKVRRLGELAEIYLAISNSVPDFHKAPLIRSAAEIYTRAGMTQKAKETWQRLGDFHFKSGEERHSAEDFRLAALAYRAGGNEEKAAQAAAFRASIDAERAEYDRLLQNFVTYYCRGQKLQDVWKIVWHSAKNSNDPKFQALATSLPPTGREALAELLRRATALQKGVKY